MPGNCGQATRPATIEIVIQGEQVRDPDHRCAAVGHSAGDDLGAEVTAENEDCAVGEQLRPEQTGWSLAIAPGGLPGQQCVRNANGRPSNVAWWLTEQPGDEVSTRARTSGDDAVAERVTASGWKGGVRRAFVHACSRNSPGRPYVRQTASHHSALFLAAARTYFSWSIGGGVVTVTGLPGRTPVLPRLRR